MRHSAGLFSDPGEARTLDPLIKSQLLYQLSYGVIVIQYLYWFCVAKLGTIFEMCKFILNKVLT